jgi:hypothetical protein
MENRKKTTQALSAAKAGLSEQTAHKIDHNKHRPKKDRKHDWETRKNPFAEIWDDFIVPMLIQGVYESTFVLEEVQKKYPDQYSSKLLRTLQRKIKRWRAISGKAKDVMFMQEHKPGELGISDFTHPKKIQVTINGEPFEHIFYHFRLPYSGFNYMQVFIGSGESYTAFAQGLQEALRYLGGVPKVHRTDSLSASFKNLSQDDQEDLTERYKAFVEHYNMQATRINPGEGHENGAIESSHRHIKNRIEQCLIVRGSADFASFDEYRKFVQEVTKQHNQQFSKYIDAERLSLQPLPETKAVDYTEIIAVVNCMSAITVRQVTYSVPSRLIGERLNVRVYNDRLECYLGSTNVITISRACHPVRGARGYKIDYRHIIESLVKKPGAFRGAKLRDAILPNEAYVRIWEHMSATMNITDASRFIVGILHLAANYDCENDLALEIIELIEKKQPLKLSALQNKFSKSKSSLPAISISQHTLDMYNEFIPNYNGTQQ